ncbi:ankyrin repeat domain-containing protein [Candidatus Uabimicrobium sp. HlEnr_7]|uniref:ankyrin repeat domain-containing protein n=1 Tax=Candidatus Uabimicrobium helgolandensis TaxID=3095367 RepID=UPI003555EF63
MKTICILLIVCNFAIAENLFSAISWNKAEKVKELLAAGADVNQKNGYGQSPLMAAAEKKNIEIVKILLDAKADVNFEGGSKYMPGTPLMSAAKGGNTEIIKLLLDAKADPNIVINDEFALEFALKDYDKKGFEPAKMLLAAGANVNTQGTQGKTVLHSAFFNNENEVIAFILEYKPDFSVKDKYGTTILGEAIKSNNLDIIPTLVKMGANIDEKDKNGNTYLIATANYPSQDKDIKKISTLLEAGADVNVQNSKGDTVLMQAVGAMYFQKDNALKIIDMLLNEKCDVNIKNKKGETALSQAFSKKYVDIAKQLIAKSANVNVKNSRGDALIFSVLDEAELLKLLVENGAELNVYNRTGYTPLMQSLYYEYNDAAKYLIEKSTDVNGGNSKNQTTPLIYAIENLEFMKLLLEKGANVKAKDKYGNTALLKACSMKNIDIVKLLLEKGADINQQDSYGNTTLMNAMKRRRVEIAKLLIEKDVDVNVAVRNLTALFYVARMGDAKMMTLLIEKGAKVNLQDDEGQTPLFYAANVEVAKLLLKAGADTTIKNKKGKTAVDVAKGEVLKFLQK